MTTLACFKAYDIRGRIEEEITEAFAYKLGRAFAVWLKPKVVVTGFDARVSSPSLSEALINGLIHSGVNVINIGLCGSEEVHFSAWQRSTDGAIMITASHNSAQYNGFKLLAAGAKPVNKETGLLEIEKLIQQPQHSTGNIRGWVKNQFDKSAYIAFLLENFLPKQCKPLTVVSDPLHGSAGLILDGLSSELPIKFIHLNHQPDGGRFPSGEPNPLEVKNQKAPSKVILQEKADLGIAWDGDFDRCFFYDQHGKFIDSYYLISILAKEAVLKYPQSKVLHDSRLYWGIVEQVSQSAGISIKTKAGHSFMKTKLRSEDACFAAESCGHYYFKEFGYSDSGMIPWLKVLKILSEQDATISQLVSEQQEKYPCLPEVNIPCSQPVKILQGIENAYSTAKAKVSKIDGLDISFNTWRFSLRASNTEPVLRLNIETRGKKGLLTQKLDEVKGKIKQAMS